MRLLILSNRTLLLSGRVQSSPTKELEVIEAAAEVLL